MSPPITPSQAADSFFAAIPHATTPSLLEQYEIEVMPSQVEILTVEILLVNVFWIQSAVRVVLPPRDHVAVLAAVQDCIHRHWKTSLQLEHHDWEEFCQAVRTRTEEYDRIVQAGGPPMAVLTEAAARLASAARLGEAHRSKLLALLVDLVPIDDLGEIAAEMELTS